MGTTSQTLSERSRTLHLIDLENLVGDPVAKGPVVGATLERYRTLAGWRLGDQAIVAANPGLLREVFFHTNADCALRPVRGHDGADLYLLAGAPPEWVAKRFGRIVIGSGDHIFATRARTIRDLGVQGDGHCPQRLTLGRAPGSGLRHPVHRAGGNTRGRARRVAHGSE